MDKANPPFCSTCGEWHLTTEPHKYSKGSPFIAPVQTKEISSETLVELAKHCHPGDESRVMMLLAKRLDKILNTKKKYMREYMKRRRKLSEEVPF